MKWKIEQAKARFSEFVERAMQERPQSIIRRGKPLAVLVSIDEYRRLRSGGKGLKKLLAAAPLEGVVVTRAQGAGRPVAL